MKKLLATLALIILVAPTFAHAGIAGFDYTRFTFTGRENPDDIDTCLAMKAYDNNQDTTFGELAEDDDLRGSVLFRFRRCLNRQALRRDNFAIENARNVGRRLRTQHTNTAQEFMTRAERLQNRAMTSRYRSTRAFNRRQSFDRKNASNILLTMRRQRRATIQQNERDRFENTISKRTLYRMSSRQCRGFHGLGTEAYDECIRQQLHNLNTLDEQGAHENETEEE